MTKIEKIIKDLIKQKLKTASDLEKWKRKTAKKYKIGFLSNVELLKEYRRLLKRDKKYSGKLESLLKTRPIRSLSGIVNVTVLTKPYPCPGQCIFCPSEAGFPKSYLSGEPAAERAKKLKYSPYLQVKKRLENLKNEGHPIEKIELRIVGGNWSSYPLKYRIWFVAKCFEACNEFNSPGKKKKRIISLPELKQLQKANEKSDQKVVGASVETRPDFINKKEIKSLRELGITMVELGVQTPFNEIHRLSRTGGTEEKIARATQLLKDAGFKVLYQMMPNLPGSNFKKDLQAFRIIFRDERFKPDWLKIYPCLVLKGTGLYEQWKKKKYRPYSCKKLIELLIRIKAGFPCWARLTRLFRDIPAWQIKSGCKILNLRELIKREMKKRNLFCSCIRCREVMEKYNPKEKIFFFRENYQASGGKEIFLSLENKKRTKLFAYLRLRVPSEALFPVLENSLIVREIKTLGASMALGKKGTSPQHRGLGKKLLKEAEKIAKKELKTKKIAVIAGIGARPYFRKLGYRLKETYMVKKISK